MYCCASGNVDACGVCDGAGDQCGTECTMSMPTAVWRRRQLLAFSDAPDGLKNPFADALGYSAAEFVMESQTNEDDATQTDVRSTYSAALGSVLSTEV